MMDANILINHRGQLLACEALAYLHNIGKLDKRFHNKESSPEFNFKLLSKYRLDIDDFTKSCVFEELNVRKSAYIKIEGKRNESDYRGFRNRRIKKFLRDKLENGCKFSDSDEKKETLIKTGLSLLSMFLQDGVNLNDQQLSDFINTYCSKRHGSAIAVLQQGLDLSGSGFYQSVEKTRLTAQKRYRWWEIIKRSYHILCPTKVENRFSTDCYTGKQIFPWGMLLNLFWDDFHWRIPQPDNERRDNLSYWLGPEFQNFSHFVRVMAVCHEAISRGDKPGYGIDQKGEPLLWSNVFGTDLKGFARLEDIQGKIQAIKSTNELEEFLAHYDAIGSDGRVPYNDVSLRSYCENFGAFLKTALAGMLLSGCQTEPHLLHWRLLYFRYDGMDWINRGGRLADAVARNALLRKMLTSIRTYLEVKLPLGQCIYADTNGAFFLVPDLPDLLDLQVSANCQDPCSTISLKEKLRALSLDVSEGEIVVQPLLSGPMKGYDVRLSSLMQGEPDATRLPPVQADANRIANSWREFYGAEVCTVCHLRPVSREEPAHTKKICGVCHQRRTGRSKAWVEGTIQQSTGTIWTSELADSQGRCALLAGRLEINQWLDGSAFQTLQKKYTDGSDGAPPGTSFTRIRDVWKTTERFWQDCVHGLLQSSFPDAPLSWPRQSGRWQFTVNDPSGRIKPYHAYEIVVPAGRWQVVCTTTDKQATQKNLCVIDRKASACTDEKSFKEQAGFEKSSIIVKQRHGYGGVDEDLGTFNLSGNSGKPQFNESPYAPCVVVLSDPLACLLAIPADQALQVAQWLRQRYCNIFQRVQDRLPLHLGVVYFPERTPAYTVLDAGLRILRSPRPEQKMTIDELKQEGDSWCLQAKSATTPAISFTYPVKFCGLEETWYVQLWKKSSAADSAIAAKEATPLPQLENKDEFLCCPSSVDITYLSTTSKRYALWYNENGLRRDEDFGPMPVLPETLAAMDALWVVLATLSRSQLAQLEAARHYAVNELQDARQEARTHYLHNALHNAGDGWWPSLTTKEKGLLEKSLETELLWVTLRHHLHLLKLKPLSAPSPLPQEAAST